MNLHKHFNEQDLKQASIQYECLKKCVASVKEHASNGDLEFARKRGQDMMNSLSELMNLNAKKRADDEVKGIADQMIQQGLNVQAVRSFYHDRQAN